MAFRGWPAEAIDFFEGLEADNTKTYWQEHKKDYEELVRQPMEELLAELAPQFGDGKIFRPYRDTRFSADKTPYKTNIAANNDGLYITVSTHGFGVGSGYYMMEKDQLERYRKAVDHDRNGPELEQIVAAVRKKKLEISTHEGLKSAPKGYAKDHPRIELLRYKDMVAWRQWDVGAWLGTKAPKQRALDFYRDSRPLVDWLDANVGPTTNPDR